MIDPDLIAEGKAKLAAATVGSWTITPPEGPFPADYWAIGTEEDGLLERFTADPVSNAEADVALVAWLLNNAAILLDAVEGSHVALGRLKQAVEQDYTAIAAKQKRDNDHIDELERRLHQAVMTIRELTSDE